MRADKQHDLPLCPVTNTIDIGENDAEEDNLAAEPKDLHDHPQEKVRLETQLANERVAQHDGVDFDVTPHHFSCPLTLSTVNHRPYETFCAMASRDCWPAGCGSGCPPVPQRRRYKLSDRNDHPRSHYPGGYGNRHTQSGR